MISETELAYLAGIIDGEGHVSIVKRTTYFVPLVTISNTFEPLILKLAELYQKLGITYNISYQDRGERVNAKPAWTIAVQSKAAVKYLLEAVFEYLLVKKEQAKIVIGWCSHEGRRRNLQEADLEMITQIRNLNKRGRVR